MTSTTGLDAIASRLVEAERTRTPIEPVRNDVADLATAYRVQNRVRDLWLADGRRMVGYKIGATSQVVRDEFGLTEPDAGVLWADTVYPDGAEVSLSRFVMPRIETEIAFVLRSDVTSEQPTVIDLLRATDFVAPAMEIADCRVRDWDTTVIDSVCDNGSGGGAILGCRPVRPGEVDLRGVSASMRVNGREVASGLGSACMGNPWVALTWLTRFLSRSAVHLRAGDIVLSGALLRVQPLRAGTIVESEVSGLGTVQVDVGP